MPIPPRPFPRPSKQDLIAAMVLSGKISQKEKEFILILPTEPSAPASSKNRILDATSLQHLTQEGVIMNIGGIPTLTYFGKVVRYRILLDIEVDKHPKWSEPGGW